MEIFLAKEAGFCFGVKRAADLTLYAAKNSDKVETLGSLIHNKQFTKFLEKKGIFEVGDINNIKASKIVIRSHGITKNQEKTLRKKGVKVIDATCPFVKRVQNLAEKLERDGFRVLILGEKGHPEVIGIRSYISRPLVIKNTKGMSLLRRKEKIALVSQTTQELSLFKKVADYLRKNFDSVKIFNTICDATEKRQRAAIDLAKKVGIMIVVGGRHSSNTSNLKKVCESYTKTYHIETEKELKNSWFVSTKSIGVTAGASTPDFVIKAVLNKLKNIALSKGAE